MDNFGFLFAANAFVWGGIIYYVFTLKQRSRNLEKDMEDVEDISVSQESSGTYSLEYLDPIVKAVGGTADSIICEFSSEKPLRIEFKVTNIGRIHFYLAPRVES